MKSWCSKDTKCSLTSTLLSNFNPIPDFSNSNVSFICTACAVATCLYTMCCEIHLATISHKFYLSSHPSTFYQSVICLHFPNSWSHIENHIPTGNITESGVKWTRTKVSDLISVNPIVASINLNEVGVVKEINYDVHPCLLHGFIGIILLEGPKALSFWPRNKFARSFASACPFTSLPVVVYCNKSSSSSFQ